MLVLLADRVNTSGSSQWITLAGGLRQFVSDGEQVEISEAAFASFKPGGKEPGSTVDQEKIKPPEMDIWWALKMGLSGKVEAFIKGAEDSQVLLQSRDAGGHTLAVGNWCTSVGERPPKVVISDSNLLHLLCAYKYKIRLYLCNLLSSTGRLCTCTYLCCM